jgi:hypothetical protein
MAVRRASESSLSDLAATIERIAGDDEITSRIVLNYLRKFRTVVQERTELPSDFFSDIIVTHWPYASDPPELDDYIPPSAQAVPETAIRRDLPSSEQTFLSEIQRRAGRKVKGPELISFCKLLAEKAGCHLPKRQILSKPRLLGWMVENTAFVQPVFDEGLTEWLNAIAPSADATE